MGNDISPFQDSDSLVDNYPDFGISEIGTRQTVSRPELTYHVIKDDRNQLFRSVVMSHSFFYNMIEWACGLLNYIHRCENIDEMYFLHGPNHSYSDNDIRTAVSWIVGKDVRDKTLYPNIPQLLQITGSRPLGEVYFMFEGTP